MSALGTWRSHLSFSERLSSIVKMHVRSEPLRRIVQTANRIHRSTAEYKIANPDVAPAEASQRCKALEAAIFGEATEVVR
jgi:hypothetical protein